MEQPIHTGALRVHNDAVESVATDGTVLWRWCPPEVRVVALVAIPGQQDTIVLSEPLSTISKGTPTAFRVRPDGSLRWTAEVPSGGDGTYVSVEAMNDELAANTWDGRRVRLDVNTGRIKDLWFVK